MSILKEYEDSLERDFDIMFREHAIEFDRLNYEYAYECAMVDSDLSLMEESEEGTESNKPSGFANFIDKVVKSIGKLITDFCDMIKNIFNTNEHLTTSDYLSSDTGKIQLEMDMEKIQKNIDRELLEGRKIIQLISKGTKIPASTIADFTDKCARACKDHGKMIIGTAGAMAIVKGVSSHMKRAKSQVDDAGEDAKKCADKEGQTSIQRVMSAINKMMNEYTQLSSIVVRNINKETRKKQKENKKNN